MANFKVIFDSCVLFPYPVANLLMWQSETNMFSPKWTTEIRDEATNSILKKYPNVNKSKILQRFKDMENAVEEPLVKNYSSLEKNIKLPDSKDRHVVAAAIKCNAELIVTFNLKDFPKNELKKFNTAAIHPDEFLCDLFDLNKGLVLEKVRLCRTCLKNPPYNPQEFFTLISNQNLKKFSQILLQNVGSI